MFNFTSLFCTLKVQCSSRFISYKHDVIKYARVCLPLLAWKFIAVVDFSFPTRNFSRLIEIIHPRNMSRFEDLFNKKKEAAPVLDLSKSTATTKEEFKKLMEKVPDFKMRPVKVRPEEIKIKEKDCKEFKLSKKELRYLKHSQGERERQYVYTDPIPTEMR